MVAGLRGASVGGRRIRARLLGRPRAGDGRRDGIGHQDPAQCQLGHADVGRDERAELLDEGQAGLVVEARERLAHIEGLAVAVERAVVGLLEGGARRELAGEQAGGQRHAREDAHVTALRGREEMLQRPLSDDVEDDLDAGHAGILDGLEAFLDALDADAIGGDGAGCDELVEGSEDLGVVVDVGGWAMQLHQVQPLDPEVLATAVDPAGQGVGGVVRDEQRNAAAGLGGHDETFARSFAQEAPDEPLAVTVPVDVSRVVEADARVRSRMQRAQAGRVVDLAPAATDGPRAKADAADLVAGLAQSSDVHAHLP